MKVILEPCGLTGYMAYIEKEGRKIGQCYGESPEAALGGVVICHHTTLGVEIERIPDNRINLPPRRYCGH